MPPKHCETLNLAHTKIDKSKMGCLTILSYYPLYILNVDVLNAVA